MIDGGLSGEVLKQSLNLLRAEASVIDDDFRIIWMNASKKKRHPRLKEGDFCFQAFNRTTPCPFCLASTVGELNTPVTNPVVLGPPHSASEEHLTIKISPVRSEEQVHLGYIELIDHVEHVYQTNARLQRLNTEYENIIFALSHDLRAPLVSIQGFLRKLTKKLIPPTESEAHHCLSRIGTNVKTMNSLVMALLDTSRITQGKLDFKKTNLKNLITHVVDQQTSGNPGFTGTIEVAKDFPTMIVDPVRIHQVFSNIISNAIKHSQSKEDLKIQVGSEEKIFFVRDNGPGIPADFQDKVFEAFSQGQNVGNESFGLGLSIVQKIVEKHDGQIWLESSEGIGTTIYFTLSDQIPN